MKAPSAIDIVFGVPELLAHVLGFCALRDVPAARRVCKRWRNIRFTLRAPITSLRVWTILEERSLEYAKRGDLLALQDIITLRGPNRDFTYAKARNWMRWACKAGHVHIARWLVEHAPADTRWDEHLQLQWACVHEQFSMVEWLVEHFGLQPSCASDAIREKLEDACRGGQHQVVQCIARHFIFPPEALLHAQCVAIIGGHRSIAGWLTANYGLPP